MFYFLLGPFFAYAPMYGMQHSATALIKVSGLLTTVEAAKRADVEPATIVSWIRYGLLRAIRFGPIWVIAECELEEYLAERGGHGEH